MSQSFTISTSNTFTVTHARHLASKVATDLKRIQRFYGSPSDATITDYELELTEFLRGGYLSEVIYGFKRSDKWVVPTLLYTASEIASGGVDDDPGRVRPGSNIAGAYFTSLLTLNQKWYSLSASEKENFEKNLPFRRASGSASAVEGGYFATDNTYSSGGRSLGRASVRSY